MRVSLCEKESLRTTTTRTKEEEVPCRRSLAYAHYFASLAPNSLADPHYFQHLFIRFHFDVVGVISTMQDDEEEENRPRFCLQATPANGTFNGIGIYGLQT